MAMAASLTYVNIDKLENLFIGSQVTPPSERQHNQVCKLHEDRALEYTCIDCSVEICLGCKLCEHEGHKIKSLQLAAADALEEIVNACNGQLKGHRTDLEKKLQEKKKQKEKAMETADRLKERVKKQHGELLSLIDENNSVARASIVKTYVTSVQETIQQKSREAQKVSSAELAAVAATNVSVRCAFLSTVIAECFHSANSRLDAINEDIMRTLTDNILFLEGELARLRSFQNRCDDVMKRKAPLPLLSIHREIQSDWSEEVFSARLAKRTSPYSYRLELQVSCCSENVNDVISAMFLCDRKDLVTANVSQFLGNPVKIEDSSTEVGPYVRVSSAFCCSEDPETYVFSVCPVGDPPFFFVSHITSEEKCEVVTKAYSLNGNTVELSVKSPEIVPGIAYTAVEDKNGKFCPLPVYSNGLIFACRKALFAKSRRKYVILSSYSYETIILQQVSASSLPLMYLRLPGSHLASNFDVSQDAQTVAINGILSPGSINGFGLATAVELRRQVCIYRKGSESSCTLRAVYEPPSEQFFPTDVCFFLLHNKEVLLIADMATDSIHVVDPDTGRFQRHLVDDHHLLKQPTALNTDSRGRVWVGCKGGQLLAVEVLA